MGVEVLGRWWGGKILEKHIGQEFFENAICHSMGRRSHQEVWVRGQAPAMIQHQELGT